MNIITFLDYDVLLSNLAEVRDSVDKINPVEYEPFLRNVYEPLIQLLRGLPMQTEANMSQALRNIALEIIHRMNFYDVCFAQFILAI